MAFDYLKFLNDERLKAKEEVDSARLKLNLIMYEQYQEQRRLIHRTFDFKMMAKAAESCIGVSDEAKDYRKNLAVYISDFFGIDGIEVGSVWQYGYDSRCYIIRFNVVSKKESVSSPYELRIPNLRSMYWDSDTLPSEMDPNDIQDLIYYMNAILLTVKGSEKASVCEEISSYLKDPDGFRNILKEGV